VDTAVLDACVLFRSGVRDFLLWVAEAGAFSPVWSDAIHEEWMRSRRDEFGDPMSRLNWARNEMEKAFPGANVAPDPDALSSVTLPDASDTHVVATAIAGNAGFIVTYNRRHFPARILAPLGLRTETPDEFCSRLFGRAQADIIEGARLHRVSLRKPTYDRSAYLAHLKALDFSRTADLLRPHQETL
jgi:predicted nucleic acid-binding protein